MSENREWKSALSALDVQLNRLETITEVNSFLVSVLREHQQELLQMTPPEARAFVRDKARALYEDTEGAGAANPQALALLEDTLGTGATAQIIPFPRRS